MLLNLLLMNKEGLSRGVKVGDSLGYSDHEIVEFSILHEGSRAASQIATLGFSRANFSFSGDLFGRIPWGWALQEKRVQERWSILKAQEWCILMSKKLGKGGKTPAWMNTEYLSKLTKVGHIQEVEAGTGHLEQI